MNFTGFTEDDFNVFTIDGLDARMDALKDKIRPKLNSLGEYFAPTLSVLTGDEMYIHVAKHARRTVNPPKDTWVAFASNPRGYKMLPHFQIGLWETHLFIWFAVIYESPQKQQIGEKLTKNINKFYKEIPGNFCWSSDHTKPDAVKHSELSKKELIALFQRMKTVKKSEILCGLQIDRDTVVKMGPSMLLQEIDNVFRKILPLYKMS
ncbi:DUF1054 domain-containing protein [Neobacillus sp. PS3-34]|uniref:YktB family protein n=1 Tax=Neobacillus sp. PS3-34 TaxID=3070678 RepID=UPI0027DF16EC|nr:DUF1054 domain-containing protein [Neobacillus sp. PS3-34]WML49396.1 DUF1054 domain-containing protein [Neobacillus sp. PS3-34]